MTTLERLRAALESYGCVFEPGHRAFFFHHPTSILEGDEIKRREVYYLDALYAALAAPEAVVALRAYVQACEYSSERRYAYLRYHYETAFVEAKNRIERFLTAEYYEV